MRKEEYKQSLGDLRLGFGEALNLSGSNWVKGLSDCFNYGSTWGCDEHCPQLLRGGCPNIAEVIDGEYKGKPIIDDADTYDYLKELYKDQLNDGK